MVHKKINKRKTIRRKKNNQPRIIFLVLFLIFMAAFCAIGCCFLLDCGEVINEEIEIVEIKNDIPEGPEVAESKPKKIDFQPVIDEWVKTVGGNKSILIYDLDREELAGSYDIARNYNTASLYKLFVVYEGYRRLESGEWQANERAGNTGYTILECLDLSIRESYSPCAETLWAKIGHDELDEIIRKDFNITNSDISHLVSNVSDIVEIMKLFYIHPDIENETFVTQIKDSFLNQPTTEYNWRQGLPSGFMKAKVYNKVGWEYNPDEQYWNIYHDAAIVEFPDENRHFVVVVMTNKIPYQQIRKLGKNLEDTFFSKY